MHNEKTNNWGDSSYSGITSVECVCVCACAHACVYIASFLLVFPVHTELGYKC